MKKLLAILLVLSLAASGAACGKGGKTPAPTATATASAVPDDGAVQVSVGLWDLGQAVEGKPSGQLRDYLADVYGVEFVPWSVTQADAREKLSAAAASGTLPDMFVQGIYDDAVFFRQLVDQKLIREIPESLFKNFHYLGTTMYRYRHTEAVDGAMWFVPRADMSGRYDNGGTTAIWYRLDWALESGIVKAGQAPSWQEFMNLMAFYATSDMDQNGSDDTYALTAAGPGLGGLGTAFFMTFGVRDWVLEDGKWIPGMLSQRAKEAAKWANQAFRSGWIDPAFSTQSEEDALRAFCTGKAGMLVADCSPAGADRLKAALQTLAPGVDMQSAVSVLPQPVNPWGVAYNEDTSYSTGMLFSAAVDDNKLKKILAVMDWLMSESGLTYANWGEKGTDYNVTGDGLQTLHRDDNGLPVTFGQLDTEWGAMAHLSTWAKDFMPAVADSDCRLKFLDTLKNFWWANDWRRPMFTKYIPDPAVQGFDADGKLETGLAEIIMRSSNVDQDWDAYVAKMTQELNVDAVAKIVNDYAAGHQITTEE